MIIDFHTHVYPEKVAKLMFPKVEKQCGLIPATDGTMTGLLDSMNKNNIDYSVVLPVVTNPRQFGRINEYAGSINDQNGIISFGGIHPDSTNIKEELREIKALGLKGIKLHPDYQETFINDPKMLKLINAAAEEDLIIVIHGGIDIGLPHIVHCPPDKTAKMLNAIDYENIIIAHIGGWKLWDDVENYLVGRSVYFDLSFSLNVINDDQFLRILKSHGAEKLLYGSDSPWENQGDLKGHMEKMDISTYDKDLIYYKNAQKLLFNKSN